MIIRLERHKRHEDIVCVHTPFELARMMGMFEGARWDADARCYLIEDGLVGQFFKHAHANGRHTVLDERTRNDGVDRWLGPLPECRHCGQPASRTTALRLTTCPDCGQAWEPKAFRMTADGQQAVPPNAAWLAARAALNGRELFKMPDDVEAPPF